jgi:hypothetical protein
MTWSFSPSSFPRLLRFHKKWKRYVDPIIKPVLNSQTTYQIWETTPAELLRYEGEARNFPGGYREIADQFLPGVRLYRFKYLKPGSRLGSAYDVFVYVKGRWRVFPRPWTVSDELGGF